MLIDVGHGKSIFEAKWSAMLNRLGHVEHFDDTFKTQINDMVEECVGKSIKNSS